MPVACTFKDRFAAYIRQLYCVLQYIGKAFRPILYVCLTRSCKQFVFMGPEGRPPNLQGVLISYDKHYIKVGLL